MVPSDLGPCGASLCPGNFGPDRRHGQGLLAPLRWSVILTIRPDALSARPE